MEISLLQVTLIPVVVGLVQVIKIAGAKSKWLPAIAVALGVAGAWVLPGEASLIAGIVIGLSSVGLYSTGKTVLEK